MTNRHQRRSDLRSFKREAHREQLLTYLLQPDDPALTELPLLQRARSWLDALSTRVRHWLSPTADVPSHTSGAAMGRCCRKRLFVPSDKNF
jgi:hypothetical protein